MDERVDLLVKVSITLFMLSAWVDMGLRLNLREALKGLRNMRFVVLSVLWGYILFPALGYLLTKVILLMLLDLSFLKNVYKTGLLDVLG